MIPQLNLKWIKWKVKIGNTCSFMHKFGVRTSLLVLRPEIGLLCQSLMSVERWLNGNRQGNMEALGDEPDQLLSYCIIPILIQLLHCHISWPRWSAVTNERYCHLWCDAVQSGQVLLTSRRSVLCLTSSSKTKYSNRPTRNRKEFRMLPSGCLLDLLFYTEDRGSNFLRNASKLLPNCTTSHPRR
jgi:hypothetical protein